MELDTEISSTDDRLERGTAIISLLAGFTPAHTLEILGRETTPDQIDWLNEAVVEAA